MSLRRRKFQLAEGRSKAARSARTGRDREFDEKKKQRLSAGGELNFISRGYEEKISFGS